MRTKWLLLQIGVLEQVQGCIYVRYVWGCEGNRCLFTGRGGELMALSPLCSEVWSFINAAQLFIHTCIFLALMRTHTQSCRCTDTHIYPLRCVCICKSICAQAYMHTHTYCGTEITHQRIYLMHAVIYTHTHTHKPHLNSTPATLMTLNIINHNKTLNGSAIYLWLKLLFIAVMMNPFIRTSWLFSDLK